MIPFLFTCKKVKTFALDRLKPVLIKTMLLGMVAMGNNIGSLPTFIGTPQIQLNCSYGLGTLIFVLLSLIMGSVFMLVIEVLYIFCLGK